jgi:excisionase family DNA binding protein
MSDGESIRRPARENLTPDETAEFLRVSRTTLERLRQAGLLRPARVSPGRMVYRRVDVEEYVASTMATATA